jgi:hypothetical protein
MRIKARDGIVVIETLSFLGVGRNGVWLAAYLTERDDKLVRYWAMNSGSSEIMVAIIFESWGRTRLPFGSKPGPYS